MGNEERVSFTNILGQEETFHKSGNKISVIHIQGQTSPTHVEFISGRRHVFNVSNGMSQAKSLINLNNRLTKIQADSCC